MKPASASPIELDPRKLVVDTLQTAGVLVSEQNSTERFTSTGSKCKGLVTWSPEKGTARVFHVTVKAGKKTGSCTITFADADHNTANLTVLVKPEPTSASFPFAGFAQNFTVPNGVSSLTIVALGAQGGYAGGGGGLGGGLGGSVTATIPVTAGAKLTIYVGGMGGNYQGTVQGGGFNGGGGGGCGCGAGSFGPAGGGGGASDVRVGKGTLSDRIIVAGGGGGSAYEAIAGGAGGGLTGGNGIGTPVGFGGGGATQTAGGIGGAIGLYGPSVCNDGLTGALGLGGEGGGTFNGTECSAYGGGGGGGGYYGGGGGGAGGAESSGSYNQGSGGGGSGYAEASATNVVMASGVQSGNGSVTFTWKNPTR